jgi:hypothetical protein
MTTIAKKLIEQLYEDEAYNRMTEATLVKVTLQGNVEDIAMMNAIAERFGQTRFALSREILNNVIMEMFLTLSPSDQLSLSVKADAEITEHKKKVGFTDFFETNAAGTFEDESGHWRGFAAICEISRKKKAENAAQEQSE